MKTLYRVSAHTSKHGVPHSTVISLVYATDIRIAENKFLDYHKKKIKR